MKKIFTLATMALAFSAAVQAQDFTTLTTPEEILANSLENEAGAKTAFEAVLDNAEATDAEKADAMHLYMQLSTPAPGYAYDMSFLLSYNAVHETVSTTTLNTAWKTEVPGVDTTPSQRWIKTNGNDNANPPVPTTALVANYQTAFQAEESFGKFIVYQEVELTAGAYYLSADAYAAGAAKCANLAAGDAVSDPIIGGGVLKAYNVSFNITDASQNVKIGIKRNDTAGKLTHIYFNDMYLYKVSNIIAIKDDANGALAAAEGVDVQLQREFKAGVYYPICLPFVISDWHEYFEEVVAWVANDAESISFNNSSAQTMARKPYLVKVAQDITKDNYLTFKNVTITSGNAGSWTKNDYPDMKMVGNWAAGTVPADCYYLEDGSWKLSDGTAPLTSFSAYMDATVAAAHPEVMAMKVNNQVVTSIVEVAEAADAPAIVNVYNLQGMVVKAGVSEADALEGLPRGLYIVNGKKVVK